MSQSFKSVYFSDFPSDSPRARHVKIAFSEKDRETFAFVKGLSSVETRCLLGHDTYASLSSAAEVAGLSLNAYCVRQTLRAQQAYADAARQRSLPFDREELPAINPIQATYRGGRAEPLHDWYPYLEGYSPQFVESLIKSFAPNAKHVIDPFAGAGTTPLSAAALGLEASFCEVNPLLTRLIDAKVCAHQLSPSRRNHLVMRLADLARSIASGIPDLEPDRDLQLSYAQVFGDSRFFSSREFKKVLRLRTLIDEISCSDPEEGLLVTIAALGALIPASRLIRRGDLRFKTDDEDARKPSLALELALSERLELIARDLEQIQPLGRRPTFLAADARKLTNLPPIAADLLITSPPYLNGTNYFRNAKVELWFLRGLIGRHDLAAYRAQAVTAGINDVTSSKPSAAPTRSIAELVARLERDAYDVRIPRMVQTYFFDLAAIIAGLRSHLSPQAPVILDIGDSAYGGIHVDTPGLLSDLMIEAGFQMKQRVTLRQRRSRGGLRLEQVLLVAEAPGFRFRRTSTAKDKPRWLGRWTTFKQLLPHQEGERAKRNWGHPWHSLCSYQGKMKPSLAAQLINSFVSPGSRVLDPFGGVGTIPFEAALAGATTWSFDISPPATYIAGAKLRPADLRSCHSVIQRLSEFVEHGKATEKERASARAIRFNGPLEAYFHPKTFDEILAARRYFKDNPPTTDAERLVLACLLHVLHGNRPYALSRRSHPITPFAPTGPAEYKRLVKHVEAKLMRTLEFPFPAGFVRGEALHQDATLPWPQAIDRLDAVITSPPFFDSTRFYLANWLRLWFCGWELDDFRSKPQSFVDERQKKSFDVYAPVFRQARERLSSSGVVILHLGRSRKCDMAEALASFACRWFRVADVFAESVAHCESHGIRDKGTVKDHVFLVLN